MTDPGLRFWLDHVAASGGLWEPVGDSTLVMLPRELGERYRLAEELLVTDDPDVARSDNVSFLGTGHPVLTEAAQRVLDEGDSGHLLLPRPAGAAPTENLLQGKAREYLPIAHARIDASGKARPVLRWTLRVGALATYKVSTEDAYQERIERWVDVGTRREMRPAVVERLVSVPALEPDSPEWKSSGIGPAPVAEIAPALAEAHRIIEGLALRRRIDLARQLGDAHDTERQRAITYYSDVIAGIERRLSAAAPDRRALLEERLAATRAEQVRRLAEIAEKHEARHEIRPYRLHLIGVPAIRLPVDVRRGDRRYPMELDWLPLAGVFAEPNCPHCASAAPLVAGKTRLGCLICQAPAHVPVVAAPPVSVPAPKTEPATPAQADVRTQNMARVKQVSTRSRPARPAPARRPTGAAPHRTLPPGRPEKLALTLWNAVASGQPRGLRNILAPDSPAAVLHRLYGSDGLRYVIGVPHAARLESVSTAPGIAMADDWGSTSGTLTTTHGRYPFVIHWRHDGRTITVAEVLPCALMPDGGLHPVYWWLLEGRPADHDAPPVLRQLDDVSTLLASTGVAVHGVPVAGRALAAWWRVADEPLVAHAPGVIAAAVHRLVALTAGNKGLFREVATAYRVDEKDVRRADPRLRNRLALNPGRPW